MEISATEKLALAKLELMQEIKEKDSMILYSIRSEASKIFEEMPNRKDGSVEIDKELYYKLFIYSFKFNLFWV